MNSSIESFNSQLTEFKVNDHSTWPVSFYFIFGGLIIVGMESLSWIIYLLFSSTSLIPIKGKHLDQFEFQDYLFVSINKLLTIVFAYHVAQFSMTSPQIEWSFDKVSVFNTFGSLVCYFVIYDFFYTLFHRTLHLRVLYPYIHKHHHRQKAPSRGNKCSIFV